MTTTATPSLIDTAPELLELLTDIANHLEGGAPLYPSSLIFREDAPAKDVIQRVVAKARG